MSRDPEADKRAALRRLKGLNGLLILLMALIFAGVRLLAPAAPWAPWVIAFAEAALVGGLADWFAVTALFRRPLGLPIPHTAIIPRNQARIGDGIGRFISHNFLDPATVTARLAQVDLGTLAGSWLADPDQRGRLARRLASGIPAVIEPIDSGATGRWLAATLAARLGPGGGGDIAAQVLALLTQEGVHRDLLDGVLDRLQAFVDDNRELIEQRIDAQLPRWLPKAVDRAIYDKVLVILHDALGEIAAPDSPWRDQFDQAAARLIERLRQDEALRQRLAEGIDRLLVHPRTLAAFADLVDGLKGQAVTPDGTVSPRLVAALDHLLDHLATTLNHDPATRAQLQHWAERVVRATLLRHRAAIAEWIATVVKRWDTATTTAKIETQIGGDLQFIRLNGALVGGLIGLVLKTAEYLIGG